MQQPPKWFMPVAVVALLWNFMGCAAYLSDVMLKPEDIAKMTEAQQALYAARPAWSVAATALAVWLGAAGSLGLILRKRWATPLFIVSLVGVIGQDVSMAMAAAAGSLNTVAIVLQSLVLAIAVALLLLSRKAAAQGWTA